jgi:hypothetical protein
MSDRSVRFTADFFDDLDQQLDEERTDEGRPSRLDFLLYELPRLRDLLAADFEASTLAIDDVPHIRVMIQAGQLVSFASLYAHLTADGAIDVIGLELDLQGNQGDLDN